MPVEVVEGDLLEQPVEAIVNAWNRNIIPWWLLIPSGVSGAIKKRGGYQPFREVARFGPIPLGEARATSAGTLPFKAIIHVAGINMFWVSTEYSIRQGTLSAAREALKLGLSSLAMPLIGAGTGGYSPAKVEQFMLESLGQLETSGELGSLRVRIVRFKPAPRPA